LLFEAEHGGLLAVIDATQITAIRTAAVSGVATDLLARADAGDLAILGSGTQARTHLDAMHAVRKLRRVRAWSPNPERLRRFTDCASSRLSMSVEDAPSAHAAVEGADIVCTVTSSKQPVLMGEWLTPGAHVNAVGSSDPAARELDSDAVARARLYVDRKESTLAEAGDFRIPRAEGRFDDGHILGELGDLLLGRVAGRVSATDITLFKSLGIAIEDLASARHVYEQALKLNVGTRVDFGGARQ
jgi:ornithine cyclodeaminase